MISMLKVNSIRSKRAQGDTIAQIAKEENVSEPTVRKYLKMDDFSPEVPKIKIKPSILDPYKPAIEAMLDEDRKTWHKQHHSIKKIYERLCAECGYTGSYTTVQTYVKRRRAERKDHQSQYLDLEWAPGEAQVDFGQADMYERGILTREHFLTVCFPYSNVGPAQIFHGETAECVCQGLKDTFEYIKGVPMRLVFDNATGVGRKISGEIRTSELFGRFAAHYGFAYSFCNPDSGHEKGAVENKVGATRRDLFVPVPSFENIKSYNARLFDRCMERSAKNHYAKGEPELQLFMEDRAALLPLPAKPFEVISFSDERYITDKWGKVCLEGCHRYSVDPAYSKTKVIIGRTAHEVRIYSLDGELLATHERAFGKTPTDSSNPASQLSLLCSKQNGWQNSRVRAQMPETLRKAMDDMDKPTRGSALRALRDVASESGYDNAIAAATSSVEMLGFVDDSALAVMSRALADKREAIVYNQDVGLSDYDVAFSLLGGDCNG